MDHQVAVKTSAVERYLLGEFNPEERSDFEDHFFDCLVCAEEVKIGFVFLDNLRSVMRDGSIADFSFSKQALRPTQKDWFGWLKPAVLVPSFAALVISVITAYQNIVILPALQQPQLLSMTVVAPQARDSGSVIQVNRHRPMFNINFAVDSPHAYHNYRLTFEKQPGGAAFLELTSGPRDFSSFTLGVLLPSSRFPDGIYITTIRPVTVPSVLIQRYTYTIQSKGVN